MKSSSVRLPAPARRTLALLTAALIMAGCHDKSETAKADPAQPAAPATAPAADSQNAPATQVAANDPSQPAAPADPNAQAPADAPEQQPPPPEVTSQFKWPRILKDGDTTLTIYQPEIEKWDGFSFQARFAVSIQDASKPAPTFGVIWVTATSNVDKEEGVVTLTNIKITKSNFPTEQNPQKYIDFINSKIPAQSMPIPLAQIDNRFSLGQALKQVAQQPVKNTVPTIIFSDEPALLVPIQGDPVMRPLPGTNCNRVFNTNALIVQNNQGGPYYLRALNYWYKSDAIQGPWAVDPDAANPPSELPSVLEAALATKQVDPINPPQGQNPPAPDIYVSTTPTELVQSNGQPQFVPIHNTSLLEVSNSDNAIILDIGNQLFYVLISGRWFSSTALTGQPWTFVPGNQLPADFAKIPPNSDKGNVLVSVPGTPQAQEAVIANSIPQTATVQRQTASLTVDYDGTPQFNPIGDTQLQYAVNTVTPVIEVNSNSFYACSNAVWFTASTPLGPWAVATTVPPVIYTIPISSPIHYVTYVQVYGYTDSVVYVGYTPGYYGTVIAPGGTIVYGTGYVYPAYVGTTVYVAPPPTYGYGAGFAYGTASGFLFGFAAGAILGACLEPHWGCWGGGNTYNINTGNVYSSWGNHVVTTGPAYGYHGGYGYGHGAAGFNPYNGNWAAARNGSYYNPSTGTYATGHSGAYGNAYTGNYTAARQGNAYNPNTGRSAAGQSSISGNAYNGNWAANQNRSYSNVNTGVTAGSSKAASGNAYDGTYSSVTNRSASSSKGTIDTTVTKSSDAPTERSASVYNNSTGQTTDYSHTQGQNSGDHPDNGGSQTHPTTATESGGGQPHPTADTASSNPSHAYSDSSGNVYKPSSDGSGNYQKATSNGWQNADHSQTQDLNRQSQASGSGSRWGGDGGGGGGDRWGSGSDRWGGGGGGGDRFGGGGGGGRFGGGGRSWR